MGCVCFLSKCSNRLISALIILAAAADAYAQTPTHSADASLNAHRFWCGNFLRTRFRSFDVAEEALAWLQKSFEPRWSAEEAKSLDQYSALYTLVNVHLRGTVRNGIGTDPTYLGLIQKTIEGLDSLITRRTVGENLTVYHVEADGMDLINWDTPIGREYVDPQYLSTSLTMDAPRERGNFFEKRDRKPPVYFEINVPAGSHATPSDVSPAWDQKWELQLILARNGKYRVAAKRESAGMRFIVLELIP